MITSLFLLYGCSDNEDSVEGLELASKSSSLTKSASESHGSSEIHRAYPKEEAEVLATFGAIATNITLGAGLGYGTESDPNVFMDQLISFHDYEGYYFTEFRDGGSYHAEENEVYERTLFGTEVDVVQKFAAVPGTLKVAVYYGNVANLTFISDFELWIGGTLHPVNNLITLLFVKTDGEWKMVHEHHSPVNVAEPGVASLDYTSEKPVTEFDPTQNEVYATFGAIAESIRLGAGHGYDGPYMDELISFHAYGKKFTEFNNGESFDSSGNEHNERKLFGEDLEEDGVKWFGFAPGTLNIAVYYGNVANLTFVSDFILDFKDGPTGYRIHNLITLLFVKIKGEWKLVHEHHSPYAGADIALPGDV
ncbi:nuclear transport factor 2 family protein [Ancylomarina sp. YFZ004]